METGRNKVTELGKSVADMAELGMLILFSADAPKDLLDYCVVHEQKNPIDHIQVNDQLFIGNDKYHIMAVGDTAVSSFNSIGHLTLKFNQSDDSILSGTIYLAEDLAALPKVNEEFYFQVNES